MFRPKCDEQRVISLAKTEELDPIDIKQYVRDIQAIQAHLIRIDTDREHYESKAPKHLTRFSDNLAKYQKEKMSWLRDQWRSREKGNDMDCFHVAIKLQEVLCDSDPAPRSALN